MHEKELVSVIIPTVKGDPQLKNCIKAVENSTYKYVEIIVVNEGLERSAQRNIGIKRARGKYLLILDSDQIISRYLIQECVDKISCCTGIYIPETITTKGFFGRLRDWERGFYTGTAVDVVRFVHAKHCPLFDETMSGPEDSDWDRRILGRKLTSISRLYHQDDVGFFKYCRKKAYYTKSMKRFAEKWPNDKVLKVRYRCWDIFMENGKWKRCLKRPHLFIALMGLIFIRGVIYAFGK